MDSQSGPLLLGSFSQLSLETFIQDIQSRDFLIILKRLKHLGVLDAHPNALLCVVLSAGWVSPQSGTEKGSLLSTVLAPVWGAQWEGLESQISSWAKHPNNYTCSLCKGSETLEKLLGTLRPLHSFWCLTPPSSSCPVRTQGRGPGSPCFGQEGFQPAFLVAIKISSIVAMKIAFIFCSSVSGRDFEHQRGRTAIRVCKIKTKNHEASLEITAHH